MTYELGYDNLFLLCDFATHPTACTPNASGSGTVTVDAITGAVTLTKSASSGAMYTKWARTTLDGAGMYGFSVSGGTTYSVSCRIAGSGTVCGFFFDGNKNYIRPEGAYNESLASANNGMATANVNAPANAAYYALFFYTSSASATFSEIKACPAAQCAGVSYPAIRKAYDQETRHTYGNLATPTREGYAFGGWFTGIGGTGKRVTRYDQAQSSSMTVYANWVSPFRFGKNACSGIEEAPFTPICTRPEIGGSAPMSLNIPVPSYAMPVPPEDCVCFKFKDGDKTSPVKIQDCADNTVPQAKLKLKIEPADNDCCTGLYDITPELDITVPCIPFSLRDGSAIDGSIKVSNRSGKSDRQIDGEVTSFKLVKPEDACCTVQPVIEMKLPDCIKYYDEDKLHLGTDPLKSDQGQIMYCKRTAGGKVATMKHQLISLEKNFKECSVYPVINPITIPCCMQEDFKDEPVGGALTTNAGGSIHVRLLQTDCRPRLEVSIDPITIPNYLVPNISFCLSNSDKESVSVKYTDSDGNEQTADNAGTIQLTSQNVGNAGCKRYKPSLSLDLTGLSFQASVGSGGNVYQDDNGDLYTDGAASDDITWWYGGGLGDISSDDIRYVKCRGRNMRGYTYYDTMNNLMDVPYAEIEPLLVNDTNSDTSQGWESSTKKPNNSYAHGILSMILPSGVQWHQKGLALTLSRFIWAESGILNRTAEQDAAALVSPAPEFFVSNAGTVSGVSLNDRNASGLAIWHSGATPNTNHGLHVNTGDGLRIFGRDGRTDNSEIKQSTADKFGELDLYAHDGDFKFKSDGKLVLNDETSTDTFALTADSVTKYDYANNTLGDPVTTTDVVLKDMFTRNCDYTLPIVIADDQNVTGNNTDFAWSSIGFDGYSNCRRPILRWARYDIEEALAAAESATTTANTTDEKLRTSVEFLYDSILRILLLLGTFRLTYMHIGKAGMVTGVDNTKSAPPGNQRHTDQPAQQSSP